jgi:hypothetical protein
MSESGFQCSVRQTTLKGQVLTGSISTATLLRLILVNLPLLPDENKEEEAKLLQHHLLWLNSLCSTSRLFPADRIILFSYQPSTFLKVHI